MISLEHNQKLLQKEILVLKSDNAVLQVRMNEDSIDFVSSHRSNYKQKHLQKQSLNYSRKWLSWNVLKMSWLKK